MTEEEWKKSGDPRSMIARLHIFERISSRKWRLFAVFRCRQKFRRVQKRFSESGIETSESQFVESMEYIEKHADGLFDYPRMMDGMERI